MSESKQLTEALTNLLIQATGFRDLLIKEQDVLVRHDLNELEGVTRDKIPMIESLEKLGDSLQNQFNQHPLNKDAMEARIRALPAVEQAGVIAVWEPLQDRLRECEKLNLVNGVTVQATKKEVDQFLQAIVGKDNQSGLTYGKDAGMSNYQNRDISEA